MRKLDLLILCNFLAFHDINGQHAGSLEKSVQFGGYTGLEFQNIAVSPLNQPSGNNASVEFELRTPGMSIGAWYRRKMLQGIAFQAELGFFHTRNTAILRSDNREQRLTYTFSDIELPMHFVFSNQIGKYPMRSVLSFGGRVGVNTINHLQTQGISLYRARWALDVGLGLAFSVGNLQLQPELVYSYCMNNIHDLGAAPYDWYAGRVVRDRLGLRVLLWRARKATNPPPFRPG